MLERVNPDCVSVSESMSSVVWCGVGCMSVREGRGGGGDGEERTQGVITRVTQSRYRINKRVLTVNATYVRT